ncbi:MAG: TrkA family potassium uptake protein [Clostridia bacterium]|nr:TrkA family potassium uptake protein [Clostridia bacterium]
MKGFCVIGLGNFGVNLALSLSKLRHQVLVIDESQEKIDFIGNSVENAVCGDATNEAVLRAAGVKNCECAVICMENNLSDSILITLLLKELGIKRIVVRATDERQKKVLLKVGADHIVLPEKESGTKLAYTLSKRDVIDYFAPSSDFTIAEIITPKSWVGKTVIEIDVRKKYNVNIIAVAAEGEEEFELLADPNHRFSENEKLVLAGGNKAMQRLTGR